MKKGLLLPTLLALVSFAILVGLGTWQMQRRDWKLSLIEQIETRATADPISLDEVVEIWDKTKDVDHIRVVASGHFDHSKERHLFTVEKGRAGWRIFTPLKSLEAGTVFVDRGFVPAEFKDIAARRDGLLSGELRITGLAREPSHKGFFTPENQPDKNEYFWRSLAEMSDSVYRTPPKPLVPFFLEAQTTEPPAGPWPKPGIPRLTVPNKHLEYALTWYSLALTLLCVYAFFVRTRFSER